MAFLDTKHLKAEHHTLKPRTSIAKKRSLWWYGGTAATEPKLFLLVVKVNECLDLLEFRNEQQPVRPSSATICPVGTCAVWPPVLKRIRDYIHAKAPEDRTPPESFARSLGNQRTMWLGFRASGVKCLGLRASGVSGGRGLQVNFRVLETFRGPLMLEEAPR